MTSVKARNQAVDISEINFETNPFSFGDTFVVKSGNNTGTKFRVLYNGKSTRDISFVAHDVPIKIKAKRNAQYGNWQYQVFFTEESTGVAGKIYELMASLDKLVQENDAVLRTKLNLPPATEEEDNLGHPVFTITEQQKTKKGPTKAIREIKMCGLPFTESKENGYGTLMMTKDKAVADLLGFRRNKSGRGIEYYSGDVSNFQRYEGDEGSKQNPLLVATLRFVIPEYGKGTKNGNFKIYTNSCMISSIVSKSESVDQLLLEEGWVDEPNTEVDNNSETHDEREIQAPEPKKNDDSAPETSRQERLSNLPVAQPVFKPPETKMPAGAFTGKIPFPI